MKMGTYAPEDTQDLRPQGCEEMTIKKRSKHICLGGCCLVEFLESEERKILSDSLTEINFLIRKLTKWRHN